MRRKNIDSILNYLHGPSRDALWIIETPILCLRLQSQCKYSLLESVKNKSELYLHLLNNFIFHKFPIKKKRTQTRCWMEFISN